MGLDENTMWEKFLVQDTPYLHKKQLKNFQFKDKIWDIAFIDTRGYYFDSSSIHDQQLLDKFIQGLKEGTRFSKRIPTDDLVFDAKNSPTHLILAITARDVYKKSTTESKIDQSSYWFRWFSTTDNLDRLTALYAQMIASLAKHKYSNNSLIAAGKVIVLVTHMDMIPKNQQIDFKDWIIKQFREKGIPENFILFGGKECEWNQKELEQHDDHVKKIIDSLEPDEDYFEKLKSSWELHYSHHTTCRREKGSCKHAFTKDTRDGYGDFLELILNSGSSQ